MNKFLLGSKRDGKEGGDLKCVIVVVVVFVGVVATAVVAVVVGVLYG